MRLFAVCLASAAAATPATYPASLDALRLAILQPALRLAILQPALRLAIPQIPLPHAQRGI